MQGKRCGDRYPVRLEMMEILKPGSALNGWQVGGAFVWFCVTALCRHRRAWDNRASGGAASL